MPYGVDKKIGGDNEENIKWMEECVTSIMKTTGGKKYDKGRAIAICKAQLKKKRRREKTNG